MDNLTWAVDHRETRMSSTLQLQLNPKIENAMVHLAYTDPPVVNDAGNVDGDWDERKTNKDGYTAFLNVNPGVSFALVRTLGYDDELVSVTMPHDDLITVDLRRSADSASGPLSRLHIDGSDVKNERNQVVYLKGATFFPAYEIFLNDGHGEALVPALSELHGLGATAIRVFGMSQYIQEFEFGRRAFDPRNYGNAYYDNARVFCQLMGRFGLYVYWSIFPDNGLIYRTATEQTQLVPHFNRFVEQLKQEPNNLLELTNEPNGHSFNAVDVWAFQKPAAIPSCSGSYGDEYGGNLPPWPVWDFGDLHSNRSYPKQVKDNDTLDHPIRVRLGKPVGVGEPDRFGSHGNTNQRQAAASAGGALESAFYFFHSTNGKRCEVFDAQTQPCANAAFQVLNAA